MRKTVVAGAAALAVAAGLAAVPVLQAQAPERRVEPRMLLQGSGSSLGVTVRDLATEEIASAKLDGSGVMIDRVREGSAAARAGLRAGDIVITFDGEPVRSARHFSRLVLETPPDRTVAAVIVRGGARETLQVTPEANDRVAIDLPEVRRQIERGLRSLPRDFAFDFDFPRDGLTVLRSVRLGMTLTPLTGQLAEYFGVRGGVLVASVEDGSTAARAGVRAGDVITAINGRTVGSSRDVSDALRDVAAGAGVDIQVTRDRQQLTLKATMPQQPELNRLRPLRNQVPI